MNAMGFQEMGRKSGYFLTKYMDAGFHSLKVGVRPGHGLLSDVTFDTKGKPAKCILQLSSDIAEVKYQFNSKDNLDMEANIDLACVGLSNLSLGLYSIGAKNLMGRVELEDDLLCLELKAGIENGQYAMPFEFGFSPGMGLMVGVSGTLPVPDTGWTGSHLCQTVAAEWSQKSVGSVYLNM